MDPHGYALPTNVMNKLYSMVMNGEVRAIGEAKRPELAERNRFIRDLLKDISNEKPTPSNY